MRSSSTLGIIFGFLLAACGRPPAPSLAEGWEVGSGGGKCRSDWADAVQEARGILAEGSLPEFSVAAFDVVAQRTTVLYKKQVYLDSGKLEEADAVNFPTANPLRIEVGCEAFIARTFSERVELVVHEFASLLKLDDSRKQISSRLDVAHVCSRTPQVRKAIEQSLGKVCNILRSRDLEILTELNLSRLQVTALKAGDFRGLPRLSRLDLRWNRITELPSMVFAGSGLQEISGLSGGSPSESWENPLFRLNRNFLGTDSKVRVLRLCPSSLVGADWSGRFISIRGFITEIEAGAFDGILPGAQVTLCLNLTGRLVSLEAFKSLQTAARLNLWGMGLAQLPRHFFEGAKAERIQIAQREDIPADLLVEMNGNRNLMGIEFYIPPGVAPIEMWDPFFKQRRALSDFVCKLVERKDWFWPGSFPGLLRESPPSEASLGMQCLRPSTKNGAPS